MEKEVYLIGAGGHSRMLLNALELNHVKVAGLYEDHFKENETVNGYPIVGPLSDIDKEKFLIVSVADGKKREALFKKYYEQIWKRNIVHPSAIQENSVEIGHGNQIFAGCYLSANVKLGNHNILNSKSVLEHETRVGNHSHVSVGAIVCGRVIIGDRCFIGAGAVVIDKIQICNDVLIGAGAIVVSNITKPGTYVGNPARQIK